MLLANGLAWPLSAQELDRQSSNQPLAQAAGPLKFPRAPEACEMVECQWWETLRLAAEEIPAADARKAQAIAEAYAKARQDGRIPNTLVPLEIEILPPDVLARLNEDIERAVAAYLDTLRAGTEKDYRIPLAANSRPLIVRARKARYTEEARALREQGEVILSVNVQTDGRAGDIKVVRGLKYGLNEQAIESLKDTLFLPAIRDGRFAPQRVNIEVRFRLY